MFTLLGAWKLSVFGYNALDLGIYRQVFEESVRGRFWQFSIHPHSVLGDHLELFLAVLFPIYALWKSAVALIFLQAVALAITAWPLAHLTARWLGRAWSLVFAFVWLLNPAVQNMALFEFHGLIFAVPLVAFIALAFEEQRYRSFIFLSLVALTVREDVGLVLMGFGLWAIMRHRSWRWTVVPAVLGLGWLVVATVIAGTLNPAGEYKFFAYYGWLGHDWPSVISAAVTKPWLIAQQLFRGQNFSFLLALLLPFLFIPLIRRGWLVVASLTLGQLLLLPITGPAIIQTHYAALVLPFLVLASGAVIKDRTRARAPYLSAGLIGALLCLATTYAAVTIGPIVPALQEIVHSTNTENRARLAAAIIDQVPPGSVASGYAFLPALAERQQLYSVHYIFLGHQQFSEQPYRLPVSPTSVIIDLEDFLLYQTSKPLPGKESGARRLRRWLEGGGYRVRTYLDRYVVIDRHGAETLRALVDQAAIGPVVSHHGELDFLGTTFPRGLPWQHDVVSSDQQFRTVWFDLAFRAPRSTDDTLLLELTWKQSGRAISTRVLPLGGGLWPTSEWPIDQAIVSRYRLLMPAEVSTDPLALVGRVIKAESAVGLDRLGRQSPIYRQYQALGPDISIGQWVR